MCGYVLAHRLAYRAPADGLTLAYFTNFTFWAAIAHFACAAWAIDAPEGWAARRPLVARASEAWFGAVLTNSILLSAMYWGVATAATEPPALDGGFVHGGTALLLALDYALGGAPLRYADVAVLLALDGLYLAYACAYGALTGTYPYEFMGGRGWLPAAAYALPSVVAAALFLGLAALKARLLARWGAHGSVKVASSPPPQRPYRAPRTFAIEGP